MDRRAPAAGTAVNAAPAAAVLAVAVLTVALAGCGGSGGGSDDGAVPAPSSLPDAAPTGSVVRLATTAAGAATHDVAVQGGAAPLSWLVEIPQLDGSSPAARAVDAALRTDADLIVSRWQGSHPAAGQRSLSCQSDVALDSRAVLSVRTTCTAGSTPAGVSTATFDEASGRRLTLSDVLTAAALPSLASEARTQLALGGTTATAAAAAARPTVASFAAWALDPSDLEVSFEVSGGPVTVSYPYVDLGAYLARGGPLTG